MKNLPGYYLTLLLFPVLNLAISQNTIAQQRPDTAFAYTIPTPGYAPGQGPLVAIDAAHCNFHTLARGFAPFGKLLTTDGYRVQSFTLPLTSLSNESGPRVLVIANALNPSDTSEWIVPNPSAFTVGEIRAVEQWVREGGRLLLIADHMPFAGAATELAAAFGFRFLNGFAFTSQPAWPPSVFTREAQTLQPSPVTDERSGFYGISKVVTFTGSAFQAPEEAIPVLQFVNEHWSLQPDTAWRFYPGTPRVQLGGYCQGALLAYGRGKVAVFGEAAMFTAQVVNGQMKVGINSPEAPDNAAFALNVIRWLDVDAPVETNARQWPQEALQIRDILQHRLDSVTTRGIVPGITFAVRFDDGRTISLASGYSDRESKTAMRPDDRMFSGSVGKTYVAALVLRLQEKGLLDIQAKAETYLTGCRWFSRIPNAPEITVEMLLNHTAGVPEYVYNPVIWQTLHSDPDKVWSVEERLAGILDKTAVHKAGEGWSYADSHYLILGLIIEKVTGKPYYTVLREEILQPCRLDQTVPADRRTIPGLVPGYTSLGNELSLPEKMVTRGEYAFNPQLEWTGGGLVPTSGDLCRWASCLYGGHVITEASLEEMVTPVPFNTTLAEGAGYGLGCFIGGHDDVRYFGHTGFVPGYITILQYLPGNGMALAMQMNSDSLHGAEATRVFNVLKETLTDDEIEMVK